MNFTALLTAVLEMSLVSSVIVLIIMLLRKTAKNILPKGILFVLWCVVILKLILPISIPSPTSVYNVVDVEKVPLMEAVTTEKEEVPLNVVTIPAQNAVAPPTVVPLPDVSVDIPQNVQLEEKPSAVPVAPSVTQPDSGEQDVKIPLAESRVEPISVIGSVYCIVTAGLMLAGIGMYLVTAYRIRKAQPVNDERIRAILDGQRGGSRIAVKTMVGHRSIMIFGILRPTIIVPEDYDTLSDRELSYLLLHEYQHYRHFDMVWNVLMLMALCVHWFNPLVYVARRMFLCDMETACDARVLNSLPEGEKTDFAQVLVAFAERNSVKYAAPVMGFSKKNVKERVLSAVKHKKTGVIAAVVSAVLIVAVIAVFATGAITGDKDKETEETTSAQTEAVTEEDTEKTEESTDAVSEDTAEVTESETPEETTEPEETEPEVTEPKIAKIDTTLGTWRTELAKGAETAEPFTDGISRFELAFTDAGDLAITFGEKSDGTLFVESVYFDGSTHTVQFSDQLSAYPVNSNLDVVYAGGFASVGLRGNLGSYYVFKGNSFCKLERDDSVGYYVWNNGAGLSYMKQSLAFEYIGGRMDAFLAAYNSPEQFYMDFGSIVSVDGGKLSITETKWTVQDYFMSDSFIMAAERDKYAYDSVDEFVADYNSGTIGVPPTLTYSVDTLNLDSSSNSVRDLEAYNEACERLRDYIISHSDNAAGEVNRAVRIGSKGEFDSFISAVNSISPDLLQSFDTSKYSEAFFADSALVVIAAMPEERIEYNITLEQAVLSGAHLSFEIQRNLSMYIELYEPDWSSYRPATPHPMRYRFSLKYPYSLFFVSMNRDAFEYADSLSINEYRSITPMEYLYKNGEYQWTESYRNEPFKEIIRCGNIESDLKASADNIDKLGSYENQFPIKVFETYNELYDFIMGISFYELNMDPLYQLIEHYDHRYFEKNALVIAIGSEKREKDITEETDVEFYYEIVNGKMTVYVHDLTGQSSGRKYLRFYNIPHSNLAGVTEFACQYDAATSGESDVLDAQSGDIETDFSVDLAEVFSSFDNPYGNDTPADLSQYMYKPVTAQPSSPVIPIYPDLAPKVTFPTVSGYTDPF